jgi:hypothetical protein
MRAIQGTHLLSQVPHGHLGFTGCTCHFVLRMLTAQGSVLIRVSDGSRRLFYLREDTVGLGSVRITKQRESAEELYQSKTSSFAVGHIRIAENPGNIKDPTAGGGGIGIFVVLGALAIATAIVISTRVGVSFNNLKN